MRKKSSLVLAVIAIFVALLEQYLSGQVALPNTPSAKQADSARLSVLVRQFPTSTLEVAVRTKTSGCSVRGALPDSACTPGAVFANASTSAICVSGYTQTVRNVPSRVKRQVYADYDIAYPKPSGSYELDHLIPLELGGSNGVANLFPEAASPTPGFHEKDVVENYLHEQVCGGKLPLNAAQSLIARDWLAVYETLSTSTIQRLRAKYGNWAD